MRASSTDQAMPRFTPLAWFGKHCAQERDDTDEEKEWKTSGQKRRVEHVERGNCVMDTSLVTSLVRRSLAREQHLFASVKKGLKVHS